MLIDYIKVINTICTTIKSNALFDPTQPTNQRLINQVIQKRLIPGPPFPVITVSLGTSDGIWRTIGYTPWANITFNITIWCALPNDRVTTRTLTDLQLSSIKEDWESEQELLYIQSKFEEFIRSSDTDPDANLKRSLGLINVPGINARLITIPRVTFGSKRQGNIGLRYAQNSLSLNNVRVL
jgi:hypothetical protein